MRRSPISMTSPLASRAVSTGLPVDVGAGDAPFVGDGEAGGVALDDGVLERDRRVLRAQLGIRPAPDAQQIAPCCAPASAARARAPRRGALE